MNVVIVSLNSQYIHSSLAPYCLLAGMKEYGKPHWNTTVLEGTVNEPMEAICEKILTHRPDVVGFCCYIWNIQSVLSVIEFLKAQCPNLKIVVGGPEVGYRAASVLEEYAAVDYVITGEGEQSFPLLMNAIEQHQLPLVAGVSYRSGEQVVVQEEQPLETPPSPYTKEYFENLKGRIAYLETSRGCPYSCAYCLSARCGKLKFYDIERAKEEILLLANSGTKTVKFVDRTFNAHRQRAKDILRFIIGEIGHGIPHGVCFHFEIAGDLLDDETIEIFQSAPKGSMQLEVGIQSFHEPTLAYIRRKTDLNKVITQVTRLLEKRNIHVHIDLIAGLPLETYSLFRESVNKAYAVGADMLQLGFLKLLHGSPMREDLQRYPCRFHETAPYEVIDTPWISQEELLRLHKVEWGLDKLYNSGRFRGSLSYVLQATQNTPFDFLLALGEGVESTGGMSLSQVAQAFFEFCCTLPKVDKLQLRNLMVCDWLASVRGGKLPEFLQVEDPALATFRKWLRKEEGRKPLQGTPRGVALLYEPLQGVYVDYQQPDPVTGQYPLEFVSIPQV